LLVLAILPAKMRLLSAVGLAIVAAILVMVALGVVGAQA
jgi:hypothetical protein